MQRFRPANRAAEKGAAVVSEGFQDTLPTSPIVYSPQCTGAHLQILTFKRHHENIVQRRRKDRACLCFSYTIQLRGLSAILFDFALTVQRNIITNDLCAYLAVILIFIPVFTKKGMLLLPINMNDNYI